MNFVHKGNNLTFSNFSSNWFMKISNESLNAIFCEINIKSNMQRKISCNKSTSLQFLRNFILFCLEFAHNTSDNEFYVTMVVKHATSLKNVQLHFSRVFSILLLTDALFWLWCANIIICASFLHSVEITNILSHLLFTKISWKQRFY